MIRPVLWRTVGFDGVADADQLMNENRHLDKLALLARNPIEGERRTTAGPGAIRAEVGI
ncbi:MAG TPA: hypothetical protein VHM72_02955 [Solirubrobacteraceae bacterium]|nr:hypothetical protein [Solirubrobacteraceae bacterium]